MDTDKSKDETPYTPAPSTPEFNSANISHVFNMQPMQAGEKPVEFIDPKADQHKNIGFKKLIPSPKYLAIILIAGAIVIALIVIAISARLSNNFRDNNYDMELRIDNFNNYFRDTPEERKIAIYSVLYDKVKSNLPENTNVPTSGAKVRAGTARNDYKSDVNIHYGSFYVDIPAVEQSYNVNFEWSNDKNNKNLSSQPITMSCPATERIIYPTFKCDEPDSEAEAMEKLKEEFPIIKSLPVTVNYTDEERGRVHYRIVNTITNGANGKKEYAITIEDKTGGNREAAIEKIRTLKCGDKYCNPEDYNVKYSDQSQK